MSTLAAPFSRWHTLGMTKPLISLAAVLARALPAASQEPAPSPTEIVAQAGPEEWKRIAPEDLLVMDLAPDNEGNPRRVVIQLMPAPFSQGWVENVKLLAHAGYYDGLAVVRVQDNYVTQWADPVEDEAAAKPLPKGLKVMEEDEYVTSVSPGSLDILMAGIGPMDKQEGSIGAPRARPDAVSYDYRSSDPYVYYTGFKNGFPLGVNTVQGQRGTNGYGWAIEEAWPVHCYGMVGVARGMSPNTGDGTSLYTVIGHAPRQLDRNIALVGRVIEGMEHLSSLPRGKGELGFYAEDEADKRTPIKQVRLASELHGTASSSEAADQQALPQPAFEYLSTESETFARYAEARANRRDPFFIHPAGGADICNIPVPVRRVPSE